VRAVDTNVLARYYLRDDPAQALAANSILAAGGVFVPKTVLLELAWVLRSVAERPADKVLACLAHLLGLPGVDIEDREQVELAVANAGHGIDFADALHLAASSGCSELLTFDDKGYARRAAKLGLKPPVRVPRQT
jgi:predicted nucleic-acid-binding protein